MQPSSDKPSQLRVDCVTLQSAVTARIVDVGGSWGALWVCLNTCAPVIRDRRFQECLGCVGTQACAWDNGVRPTLFWKPSFIHGRLQASGSVQWHEKIKTWPISFPRREISTGISMVCRSETGTLPKRLREAHNCEPGTDQSLTRNAIKHVKPSAKTSRTYKMELDWSDVTASPPAIQGGFHLFPR